MRPASEFTGRTSGVAPGPAAPVSAQRIEPDAGAALAFFRALFPADAVLHFRSVPEPKDERETKNHHDALDRETHADFLHYCDVEGRAAYVLPGIVCQGGTGKADVLSLAQSARISTKAIPRQISRPSTLF